MQNERGRGVEGVYARYSTASADDCDDDVNVAGFFGSVGGGFGRGDGRTASSSNDDDGILVIGED